MIILGSLVVLAIFLFVGWAVATEMFQHRAWRKRVESGDVRIVAALAEEAMNTWRRARPPRGVSSTLWSGVQSAQIVAIDAESATISAAAEGEFRSEGGQRRQVSSALDEAIELAARLIDMMLYDVPNLRLAKVRVDVYSTFTEGDGNPVQRPILTATAPRAIADSMTWEAMTAEEILGRFATSYERGAGGRAVPIELPPVVGATPDPGPPASATAARVGQGQ